MNITPLPPMNIGMEWTACPMCGGDDGRLLIEGRDLLHPGDESFRLLTCQVCGHIYQNPRPTVAAIDRHYPENYIPFQKAIEDEPRWWRRLDRRYGQYRRCMPVHRAAGQPGRLLDVGCATGLFLDGMRRLGWQVQGVEPSRSAAVYARDRFGLDVFQGRLEDAGFADHSFDVVTLWDVLEHVHEPREILSDIARILRPGGLVVLSLPNPDSLEARLLGRFWLGWDLPRHLNLFRPLLLNVHLAKRGLVVEAIRSFTAGYPVLVMSLESRLQHAGYNTRAIGRILRSIPLRLLAMPYYAGPANWYNLSSIMVVFARRSLEKQ
jgi:SAM-dependent methyltransferase